MNMSVIGSQMSSDVSSEQSSIHDEWAMTRYSVQVMSLKAFPGR